MKKSGSIYIAAASGIQLVKIGYTTTGALNRISLLQTGSPVALILVGELEGGKRDEHWADKKLAKHRRHGEWFDLVGPVRALISLVAQCSVMVPKTVWRSILTRGDSPLETGVNSLPGGWLTEKIIARRLAVAVNQVRHWMSLGELVETDRGPTFDGKRRGMFHETDYQRFIDKRTSGGKDGSE